MTIPTQADSRFDKHQNEVGTSWHPNLAAVPVPAGATLECVDQVVESVVVRVLLHREHLLRLDWLEDDVLREVEVEKGSEDGHFSTS